MRLVICDGNRILSEALLAALESYDHGLNAVAVTTADECVAAVGSYMPDMCLLEVRLPETADGLRLINEIRNRFPDTAVVVASSAGDPSTVAKAKDLGVRGFLAKSRSVSEVAEALRRIASGQPVFDPVPHTASRPASPSLLTPREAEVLRRIAVGQHTRQMAREMNIAVSTLRTYIKNVFAKIGVHSRLEAAAVANRADLLDEVRPPRLPAQDQQNIFPAGVAGRRSHRSSRLRRVRGMVHPPSCVSSPLRPGVSLVMSGARGYRHGGWPLHPVPGANLR
jgi:DNA-binding NarL/FixJ family response regulator